MQFLKGLVVLASIAAVGVPALAFAQQVPKTPLERLRAEDAYLKQYEGLEDTSYVLVGYAGDEEDNVPIIMPKAVFAEMLGTMVVMGDLPPDRVTALTRHVLNQTRQAAKAQSTKLGPLRERRAQIAAEIAALQAPPPSRPGIIARARAAAAGSPAVARGSTAAGMIPPNRAPVPLTQQPVDGSIETPALPASTAGARAAAAACSLPQRWRNSSGVGSSTWIVDAGGSAREEGMGNATGRASFSGSRLVIQWEAGGYAGSYSVTLDGNCNGSGTLQFTRPSGRPSYDATFTSAGRE